MLHRILLLYRLWCSPIYHYKWTQVAGLHFGGEMYGTVIYIGTNSFVLNTKGFPILKLFPKIKLGFVMLYFMYLLWWKMKLSY